MQRVVERILNLLAFLLTVGRPVSADEIRHTVAGYEHDNDESFRRMFERDKDLLRSLGIPIQLAPTDAYEVEYGYVVPPDEYELPDPGLNDEERAALWLAAQVVRLGGQAQGPGAILKLGGVPLAAAGEPLAADLGLDADDLATAFAAVAERRTLSFTYRDKPRTLHPYGLVHRFGHWYVTGEARGNGGIRAFRIDRAQKLSAGDDTNTFIRPADFDARDAIPGAPWEAGGDDVAAVVRFDSDVAWWAHRQLTGQEEVTTRRDGSLDVSFRVRNPDAFIGWLLAFEDSAEVLDPPELRARLLERVAG